MVYQNCSCTDNNFPEFIICIHLLFVYTGGLVKPYSLSMCPILVSCLITCFVLTSSYTANLISVLSVEKYEVPFETYEELIHQDTYYYGVVDGTSISEFFNVNYI